MTPAPKILIVDDKPENLVALESVLNPLPAEILKATSGDEALRLSLHNTFALAILDVQMPVMDGFEIARLLRLDEASRGTPIIFLSAVYSDDYHQFLGYRSGAVDFITKPFNPEFLLQKVHVFLEMHKAHAELKASKEQLESLLQDQRRTNLALQQEIARRVATEAQLQAAKSQAESLSRAKSEFLATMSHEIRTPLNGIMGMLQLAQSMPMDSELKDFLDNALTSSRSLLRILSDILDISKVEAGMLDLVEEEFDLEEVIRPIVTSFSDVAARKGVRYEARVEPGLPARLAGDPSRLRQILFNLVGNAIKFTTNGQVLLEVYPLPHCPRPGWVNLHFSVTDTGIGIPEDKVGHIFGMFTQVEGSFSRRFGGTGLGLAIVRQLVGLMSGSLSIASELGHGTEMHVTLPLRAHAAPGASARNRARSRAIRTNAQPSNRVLVVEDESMNRLTAVRFLQHLGFEATGVADGLEALDLLARTRFDVVLMDIQMPDMDGLEATRRLRSGSAALNRDVPVVALTAHAMSGDRDRFLAAGMDEYLTKPMDMGALREVLDKVLDGAQPESVPTGRQD